MFKLNTERKLNIQVVNQSFQMESHENSCLVRQRHNKGHRVHCSKQHKYEGRISDRNLFHSLFHPHFQIEELQRNMRSDKSRGKLHLLLEAENPIKLLIQSTESTFT